MEWARMLAYITGTVDQELLLCNEYLATENRILKAQLKGLSFLKTSSAAEILAFQTAGDYRLRHANDHQYPRSFRPRIRSEPRDGTAGKHRSPPTSGGPEAGKSVASSARPRVLGLPFPPVATLEGRPCHRQARDGRRLAPPGVSPVLEMEIVPRKAGSPANLEENTRTHPTN